MNNRDVVTVVFGAGASYDSAPSLHPRNGSGNHPSRPPLANELFADRELFAEALERFPQCHAVVPQLRHLPEGGSVELVLERLQAEAPAYPERHRQLAAIRYYLQWMLAACTSSWYRAYRGISNYKTVLDQIARRRKDRTVCVVTFNYDSMLEEALPTLHMRISSIADYVSHPDYKVVKLHGSVNWGREVRTPLDHAAAVDDLAIVRELIERAPDLSFSDRYHFVGGQRPFARVPNEPTRVVFPAIAIPVETKKSYECPTSHVEALKDCLTRTTKLLVIGWRAKDRPFVELLRTSLPGPTDNMLIAGTQGDAQQLATTLADAGVSGTFTTTPGGFTDGVLGREVESFLER